ncbi:sulfite reductase [Prosthecomicrobium hirschii]|uniref:assimilatory sulfite reductase (NADPH) n=1 Tax=Prosthecodimorpha hirschii TaxID=665126 RepID=A0A0P6VRL7_9HYPH|nr:sulfite reductase subunit alpha [Prosthecomicrobium hirschii]KPL53826.1 sulfite reductase [Prosthecomicrobium hirschii]
MTAPTRPPVAYPLIPETAPFDAAQRAWLNGFFAGLIGFDAGTAPVDPRAAAADASAPPATADDGAPWHDPAMPMDERMGLAEGRPLPRRLMAAMAQQDCGQCGYLCESYAEALAAGTETKPNLCQPGGKDTLRMVKRLMEEAASAPPSAGASPAPAPSPAASALPSGADTPAARPGYARDCPVEATFVSATRLNGRGSAKETLHVVWRLPEGLDYRPGDSFGVFPRNDPALADAILDRLGLPADFPVAGKSLRAALIEDYALAPAPDMLFQLISYITGGDKRANAKALAAGGDPFGDAESLDVLAALDHFPGIRPDPEALLECLEPLQPRLYSISSSPNAAPGELTLTVDVVRYAIGERTRLGVASTGIADRLAPGDTVKVFVSRAHGFALPADGATPIVMIGPGTGIAPFRAFLQERLATRATGPAWLFYGHQKETCDFFYREEFEGLLAQGTLTRLSTAWSRDAGPKTYVQDRMREAGAELWSWLERGAHVYVCGDAKRMAADVDKALVEIAATHGGLDPAAAKARVAALAAAGRYQRDVY